MKLWLLRPSDYHGYDRYHALQPTWDPWYDKAFGFVVRAEDEAEAREMATDEAGDEGGGAWKNSELSTCFELTPSGLVGVVIRDFWSA